MGNVLPPKGKSILLHLGVKYNPCIENILGMANVMRVVITKGEVKEPSSLAMPVLLFGLRILVLTSCDGSAESGLALAETPSTSVQSEWFNENCNHLFQQSSTLTKRIPHPFSIMNAQVGGAGQRGSGYDYQKKGGVHISKAFYPSLTDLSAPVRRPVVR